MIEKKVTKDSKAAAMAKAAELMEANEANRMNAEAVAAREKAEREEAEQRAAIAADPTKIRGCIDEVKQSTLESNAGDLAKAANEMALPILQDYEIEAEPEQVLKWCRDTNGLKAAIISSEVAKYGHKDDPYYCDYIRTKVAAEVDKYKLGAYTGDSNAAKYVKYSADLEGFEVDKDAILEDCTKYLTGRAAENFAKLQHATNILNEVFKGSAPQYMNQLWFVHDGFLKFREEICMSFAFEVWAKK